MAETENIHIESHEGFDIEQQLWSTDPEVYQKFYAAQTTALYLHRDGVVHGGCLPGGYFDTVEDVKQTIAMWIAMGRPCSREMV